MGDFLTLTPGDETPDALQCGFICFLFTSQRVEFLTGSSRAGQGRSFGF